MEHFLKKTTSVSSSMNQSGDPPSDIKSPPLLSQATATGLRATNTVNQVEQRPSSLYTSSIRTQHPPSISNTSQVATIKESNQTNSMSIGQPKSQNGPNTLSDSSKNTTEKEYTEIERIEVPNFATHRGKGEDLRSKKSEIRRRHFSKPSQCSS